MTSFSNQQVNFYIVTAKDENQRLDNLLIKLLKGVPKSHIYSIIRSNQVRINKKRADAKHKVAIDDVIRIPPIKIDLKIEKYIPSRIFDIIFEDDYLLIIDKPSGIACHGGSGISFGVIEQLRQSYPFLELIHRLDKETSGIIMLAKKRTSLVAIQDQLRNSQVIKKYLALTIGLWQQNLVDLKVPLYKYLTQDGQRRVKVDHIHGKFCHTIFKVMDCINNKYTLVQATLKTGRTHQIRAHLKHLGYPILGDDKYGIDEINSKHKQMLLHSHEIIFTHPVTKQRIKLQATIPQYFQHYLSKNTLK